MKSKHNSCNYWCISFQTQNIKFIIMLLMWYQLYILLYQILIFYRKISSSFNLFSIEHYKFKIELCSPKKKSYVKVKLFYLLRW